MDSRLSLANCRELISSDERINDSELLELRNRMYDLAATLVAAYRRKPTPAGGPFCDVPNPHQADVEERAAILEFEANLTREQAERLALNAYLQSQSAH